MMRQSIGIKPNGLLDIRGIVESPEAFCECVGQGSEVIRAVNGTLKRKLFAE
jgi:hypothetical protein